MAAAVPALPYHCVPAVFHLFLAFVLSSLGGAGGGGGGLGGSGSSVSPSHPYAPSPPIGVTTVAAVENASLPALCLPNTPCQNPVLPPKP